MNQNAWFVYMGRIDSAIRNWLMQLVWKQNDELCACKNEMNFNSSTLLLYDLNSYPRKCLLQEITGLKTDGHVKRGEVNHYYNNPVSCFNIQGLD